MTARPRVAAAHLAAAATRLWGVVLLDLVDHLTRPAIYKARLAAFVDMDGNHLGADDDPSLVVLVAPGSAGDLIAAAGGAGRAATALNRDLRKAGVL